MKLTILKIIGVSTLEKNSNYSNARIKGKIETGKWRGNSGILVGNLVDRRPGRE